MVYEYFLRYESKVTIDVSNRYMVSANRCSGARLANWQLEQIDCASGAGRYRKRSAAQRRRRPADEVTASDGENDACVNASKRCVLK
jgi:hypothetical protein